jgi:transposase
MRERNRNRPVTKAVQTARRASTAAWIGVDLGDRWSEVCVINGAGKIIERIRVRTTPSSFGEYFQRHAGARVALETGTHSSWARRVLIRCGLAATVANAREIRKIHQSNRKNDRSDAEILARMLRFDPKLLSPVHPRSAQMQTDIAVLRARDVMVRARTMQINAVRGLVKSYGERLPGCTSTSFARRVVDQVPRALQPALTPLLETIAGLTAQIRTYDRLIETLARERYPQTALLAQVPGVGPVTSLAFVLTLSSKERFRRSRDVGAYLGLVPRQYDSGNQQSQLPISKSGNTYLRRLLVQSAQYILGPFGPDCRLRRYGQRLTDHGGKNAKKRAVVAVARKLAVLLHRLWTTGALYDPFYATSLPAIAA